MSKITVEALKAAPYLDLEEFMNFSKESRIEGETFEKLQELWQDWQNILKIKNLRQDKNSLLAVWLPEEVEKAIDNAWDESPGKGYLFHNLAQYMCMAVIQELIPLTAEGACAPAPRTDSEILAALQDENFINAENEIPRRYSVLTYYPFKGGCEICALQDQCPKGGGGSDFASVVLPGYEKGKAE